MAETAVTTALERWPNGHHPNSRANLRPIPPELRHKGKRATLKTKIRRFLNEEVGAYLFDGKPISREDRLLLGAIEDAESATEAIDRHRAINILFDRLYGKPLQRDNVRHSGNLNVNVTGKRWDELSKEELAVIIAEPEKYQERDGIVLLAEFTDDNKTESDSGASEAGV